MELSWLSSVKWARRGKTGQTFSLIGKNCMGNDYLDVEQQLLESHQIMLLACEQLTVSWNGIDFYKLWTALKGIDTQYWSSHYFFCCPFCSNPKTGNSSISQRWEGPREYAEGEQGWQLVAGHKQRTFACIWRYQRETHHMHNPRVLMKTVKNEVRLFLLHLAFMRVMLPAPSASGTHSFAQLWPDSSCNFSFFLWPELGSPLRVFLHAHLTACIHKPFPFCQDSLHWETPVEQCWTKEGATRTPWSPVTSQEKSIG